MVRSMGRIYFPSVRSYVSLLREEKGERAGDEYSIRRYIRVYPGDWT